MSNSLALAIGVLMSVIVSSGTTASGDGAGAIYQAPPADPGVPGRCARIVNPDERRKCILSMGGG